MVSLRRSETDGSWIETAKWDVHELRIDVYLKTHVAKANWGRHYAKLYPAYDVSRWVNLRCVLWCLALTNVCKVQGVLMRVLMDTRRWYGKR